jgi:hypothetical protein
MSKLSFVTGNRKYYEYYHRKLYSCPEISETPHHRRSLKVYKRREEEVPNERKLFYKSKGRFSLGELAPVAYLSSNERISFNESGPREILLPLERSLSDNTLPNGSISLMQAVRIDPELKIADLRNRPSTIIGHHAKDYSYEHNGKDGTDEYEINIQLSQFFARIIYEKDKVDGILYDAVRTYSHEDNLVDSTCLVLFDCEDRVKFARGTESYDSLAETV